MKKLQLDRFVRKEDVERSIHYRIQPDKAVETMKMTEIKERIVQDANSAYGNYVEYPIHDLDFE